LPSSNDYTPTFKKDLKKMFQRCTRESVLWCGVGLRSDPLSPGSFSPDLLLLDFDGGGSFESGKDLFRSCSEFLDFWEGHEHGNGDEPFDVHLLSQVAVPCEVLVGEIIVELLDDLVVQGLVWIGKGWRLRLEVRIAGVFLRENWHLHIWIDVSVLRRNELTLRNDVLRLRIVWRIEGIVLLVVGVHVVVVVVVVILLSLVVVVVSSTSLAVLSVVWSSLVVLVWRSAVVVSWLVTLIVISLSSSLLLLLLVVVVVVILLRIGLLSVLGGCWWLLLSLNLSFFTRIWLIKLLLSSLLLLLLVVVLVVLVVASLVVVSALVVVVSSSLVAAISSLIAVVVVVVVVVSVFVVVVSPVVVVASLMLVPVVSALLVGAVWILFQRCILLGRNFSSWSGLACIWVCVGIGVCIG